MPFVPTDEQSAIIDAPLESQCVLACAGSGKTATAVRRVIEIRRQLGRARGHVALLSYSNVAVNTFRKEFNALSAKISGLSSRVLIATADSFITSQVLIPHAALSMKCPRQPFLVSGREGFLEAHKIFNGTFPDRISKLRVTVTPAGVQYRLVGTTADIPIAAIQAEEAIRKLAKVGAYTHDLGRYWAWRTLCSHARLPGIVARRFPQILVDEAQDVGSLHGAVLLLLQKAGAVVTLIGDPNQAIFEFADADGSFLRAFAHQAVPRPLSTNRRSVGRIVGVGSKLCGAAHQSVRDEPPRLTGAYLLPYDVTKLDSVRDAFLSILTQHGYGAHDAVILCRGRKMVEHLKGSASSGKGSTEMFVNAALSRDVRHDLAKAFEFAVDGILRLFADPPSGLKQQVLSGARASDARMMRQCLWKFLRNSNHGLPSVTLPAATVWQPTLKKRLSDLLTEIEARTAAQRSPSWKNNLTVSGLADAPLGDSSQLDDTQVAIKTVHEVKGEGIDAVLYVAKKTDLTHLVAGPTSEEGRIGYVAITRARDLLILGVPDQTKPELLSRLTELGFQTLPN